MKYKDPKKEVLGKDEARLLLDYFMANPTIYNFGLAFVFYTGLHIGELNTLKKSNNAERLFCDYSGVFRATCPEFESHCSGAPEPLASSLFHGAFDMSLHRS